MNSKHWKRIADFGSCDSSIPWGARGFKQKFVETEGLSQETVDTEFEARLAKRREELEERQSKSTAAILSQIEAAKSKKPRFAAAKALAERASRPKDSETGLRI